jgi:A/G-specific adenine glycosylase
MPKSKESIPEKQLPIFREQLLAWFRREKRDLEWRRTRDPYHIWVSEIMLQQTRVAAVTPYYQQFLARFPTVSHLARAREDAVLQSWAGLGYYSRARNLRRAAREIVAQHAGKFPRELPAALALPGIGRYTASAVLSIAYGAPFAVLDGNVARVLSRLGAVRGDLRQPRIWRSLEETAARLLARDAAGDWNQAMMELGAILCTPRAPRCKICPVARWCRAHTLGIANQFPSARRQAKPVRLTLAAAVLLDPRGRTLLLRQNGAVRKDAPGRPPRAARRQKTAFFSGLWQFPAIEISAAPTKTPHEISTQLAQHLASELGLQPTHLEPAGTARHVVTFHDIRLMPFLARVHRLPKVAGARAPKLARLGALPISSATKKIAAATLARL